MHHWHYQQYRASSVGGGRMHFSGLGGFFLWGFSIYPRPLSFFRGWQHHCDCCHSGDGRGCFQIPSLVSLSTACGGRLGQGMAGDSELGQTKRAYFFKSFLSPFLFLRLHWFGRLLQYMVRCFTDWCVVILIWLWCVSCGCCLSMYYSGLIPCTLSTR
jgi:hypothetical protein